MSLKGWPWGRGWVILRGNASSDAECGSLGPEAIGAFLEASQGIEFAGQSQEEIYGWVHATLLQEEYFRQGKKGRGAIGRICRR